ncbi:MAG: hypothetical protein WCK49_09405, partial [Myxococcaceae bacterium]
PNPHLGTELLLRDHPTADPVLLTAQLVETAERDAERAYDIAMRLYDTNNIEHLGLMLPHAARAAMFARRLAPERIDQGVQIFLNLLQQMRQAGQPINFEAVETEALRMLAINPQVSFSTMQTVSSRSLL